LQLFDVFAECSATLSDFLVVIKLIAIIIDAEDKKKNSEQKTDKFH